MPTERASQDRTSPSQDGGSPTSTQPQAAVPPSLATASPPAPADQLLTTDRRDLDSETIRLLMERGKQLIYFGDVVSARLVFQRAAEAGDAAAAEAMGSTYDPIILAKFRISGLTADVDKARSWYEKAKLLGSTEAQSRLKLLAKQ